MNLKDFFNNDLVQSGISSIFDTGLSAFGNIIGQARSEAGQGRLMNAQYQYQKMLQDQQQSWIENMSNTAHRREMEDLRAAGLNPLLSVIGNAGNGASTLSGGMGNVSIPSPFNTNIETSNILDDLQKIQNIKLTKQQIKTEKGKMPNILGNIKDGIEENVYGTVLGEGGAKKLLKEHPYATAGAAGAGLWGASKLLKRIPIKGLGGGLLGIGLSLGIPPLIEYGIKQYQNHKNDTNVESVRKNREDFKLLNTEEMLSGEYTRKIKKMLEKDRKDDKKPPKYIPTI